jgi:hypothetical protein
MATYPLGQFDEFERFDLRRGDGLFAQHVLPGRQGPLAQLIVQTGRRRDHDHVDCGSKPSRARGRFH